MISPPFKYLVIKSVFFPTMVSCFGWIYCERISDVILTTIGRDTVLNRRETRVSLCSATELSSLMQASINFSECHCLFCSYLFSIDTRFKYCRVDVNSEAPGNSLLLLRIRSYHVSSIFKVRKVGFCRFVITLLLITPRAFA